MVRVTIFERAAAYELRRGGSGPIPRVRKVGFHK